MKSDHQHGVSKMPCHNIIVALFFTQALLTPVQATPPELSQITTNTNVAAASADVGTARHLSHWMPTVENLNPAQQQQLAAIYQSMLRSDYVAAEQKLAQLYSEAPAVQPLWVSLLTELQQFKKIRQLVNTGVIAADHYSAMIAALYQHHSEPQLDFQHQSGQIKLESHWLVALPRVKVILNGQPYYFVLDTGASQSLITDRVAQEAKLAWDAKTQVSIDTATDNKVKASLAVLPNFQLGPVEAKNQAALVVDRAELEQQIFGFHWYQIDGIIGWPLLKQLDLTFDFDNQQLEIRKPSSSDKVPQGNLVWLFDDPMVITNRDEQPRLWFLDTGAGNSVVTEDYLTPAQRQNMAWETKEFGGLGGEGATERVGELENIRIAFPSLATHLAQITVRADHADCVHSRCDGRLGVDVAAKRRMHINFQQATFDITK
jgi:hypothetical protein